MIRKIPTLAALAFVVFGCSRSGKMQRDQKQYDVVPEGSASGVTSTINGPEDAKPPVTETNADTTTAFTIPTDSNPIGTQTIGTIATTSTTPPRPAHERPYNPEKNVRPAPPTDTTTSTDTETTATTTTSPDTKKKDEESKDDPPPPPTDTTGTRG
jgi:hypothetical protein